jgi:hypothetical protein
MDLNLNAGFFFGAAVLNPTVELGATCCDTCGNTPCTCGNTPCTLGLEEISEEEARRRGVILD